MANLEGIKAMQAVLVDLETYVCAGESPLHNAARAHDAYHAWQQASEVLADLRVRTVQAALEDGYTYADLSTVIGISRQRVRQLAAMPPQPPGRRTNDHDRSAEALDLRQRREACHTNHEDTAF